MTASPVTPATPGRLRDRLRSPVVQLNLAGIVLVAVSFVPARAGSPVVAVIVLGVVALVAWLVWALRGPGPVRDVALVTGLLTAGVGAGIGGTSLIAPAIAALVIGISDTALPVRVLVLLVAAAAAAVAVAAVGRGQSLDDLVSLLAGLAIGTLGGTTRRQRAHASEREREVLASTLAAEREASRAQLLEARSAAARDVHDVLAHSLGGLVLQLDAIEALLEHGRVDDAATRAAAARRLAGEGLSEARRAVATLRDPDAAAWATVPDDTLSTLVAQHRALGGDADAIGDPSLVGIAPAHREALAAALREALVNARRHAPGAPVQVEVERGTRAMVLRVQNSIPARAASSVGGGHGLIGMRERFAALRDGSSVDAGPVGDRFVVEARVALP